MEGQILIVEDNPVVATQLSDQLKRRGYDTEICFSGEECLAIMERDKFSLVLLDIMMTGISGLEVIPKLRKRYPAVELPIIMVTMVDDDKNIIEALTLGANDYIMKPVNMDVAIARITNFLKTRDYHLKCLDLERLEAVKAMIVTYNHEINNPMTVAMTEVGLAIRKGDTANLNIVYESLEKITNIVRKIRALSEGEVEIEEYLGEKMVKLPGPGVAQ